MVVNLSLFWWIMLFLVIIISYPTLACGDLNLVLFIMEMKYVS